jgi:hypothetical protein
MKPARMAAGGLALAVLAGVFAAYLHPDLTVALVSALWSCF